MAYVTRDGQRVAEAVARDFDRMDTEFRRAFPGVDLMVNSGTRTTAEQEAIFRQRYTTTPNGRRVYDVRRWNGVLWYRISSAGTVAVPRTSNHEENGPVGPRALDIKDSGKDRGVAFAGNPRSNWIKANCGNFQFKANGYGFGEPWHIEWTGGDPHAGAPAAPAQNQAPAPAPAPKSINPLGIDWCAGLQLIGWVYGGKKAYRGAIDGNMPIGSKSWAAFVQFLRDFHSYVGDDQLGPRMWAAIARWLRKSWGYVGNDVPGPSMRAALSRAENANWNALRGRAGV
jgi:hypothetical protein